MPIRMTKPSEGSNFSVAIEDRFDPSEDHIVELMSMDEYNGVSTIDGKPYTSLMWHCLELMGAKVHYYIPCRMEEGYGLNCEAMRQMHAEDPSQLLITVD